MKTRFGRELVLLSLPVLLLAGFSWWKVRQVEDISPPENLEVGQFRVVVGKPRLTAPLPFDVYRGFDRRLELDSWAAGKFPPVVPSKRPGLLRTYRAVSPNHPIPQLMYRQNGEWNVLPNPIEKRTVEMQSVTEYEELHARMQSAYLIRTAPVPRTAGEVRLRGSVGAQVYQREMRQVGKIQQGDITKSWKLLSEPLDILLAPSAQKLSLPQIKRICPLELKSICVFPPHATWNDFSVQIKVKSNLPWSEQKQGSRFQVVHSRLIDARGKELPVKQSYSWSNMPDPDATYEITPRGDLSLKTWKALKRPITFQAAISQNGQWPLEVNVILPKEGLVEENPKPSQHKFRRE